MRRAIFVLTALVLALGVTGPAAAAPQILGLVAYNEPVPMNCERGQCSAELIAMCLQKHRDNPLPGQRYTFHGDAQASLLVTDAEGNQKTLPAGDYVRVSAARSFTAVKVEITERELRDLGGVQVAVTVGPGMSLLPEPVAGDPNPITADEIKYATAHLRLEADRWLKGTAPKTVAARIVNRMINNSPRSGRVDPSDWRRMWDDSTRTEAGVERAAGRERAQDIFGACRYMVGDLGQFFSMRRCLESKHDALMLDMNTKYWQSVKPGS